MAVVGDAYIVVRAITDNVKDDIRNGFKGVAGQTSKIGREAGSSFGQGFSRGFTAEAEQALNAFGKLVRKGYYVQAAFGAVAGSLSALVGGLGAFIGVAAGAAASGVALAGAMVQIKLASMVGKSAFKGISEAVSAADSVASANTKTIKELREELQQLAFAAEEAALGEEAAALSLEKARETLSRVQNLPPDNRARREAELAYQQAELKYRQAKDKNKDAQEELRNPRRSGGAAGRDPFADLTESQRVFAKYLVSIKGRFKELNEAAASGFLPMLQKQLERLFSSGAFDMLVKGYEQVGAGLGRASEELGKSLFNPETKNNIAALFESTGRNAGTFGKILGNTLKAILGLLRAADPLVTRFLAFLDNKSAANAEKIQKNFLGITAFFKNAGDAAADFGKVFGNISAGISGMITANMGPGSGGRMMLDSLRDSTYWMKQLNTGAGQFAAANYFKTTADTTMSIFRAFSGLGTIIKDLGTMPENKEFWEILQTGQGSLEKILRSAVETSPKLAELLVMITEIIASIADSDQVIAYFDLLNSVVNVFVQVFNALEPVMKALGTTVGYIGALITLTLLFRKAALLTWGLLVAPAKAYAAVIGILNAAKAISIARSYAEMAATKKQIAGDAIALVSKSLQIKAMTGMGIAADKTAISAARMWVAITGPVGIAVAILATVVASIVAITLSINAAIDAAQKKATRATTTTLRKVTKDATLTATESQQLWATAASRATDGIGNASEKQTSIIKAGVKNSLGALRDLNDYLAANDGSFSGINDSSNEQIKVYRKTFKEYRDTAAETREIHDDLKETVVGLNKSFAALAKENIYNALGAMRAFAQVNNLNDREMKTLIISDKALQDELVKHAKAIGYVVTGQDGLVDTSRLLDIAFGRNSYKARLLTLEYEKIEKQVDAAIASFGTIKDAMDQNITTAADNTKKFNFSGFIKSIQGQGDAALNYAKNMEKLRKKLGKENTALFSDLVSQGESAAGLVQALLDTSSDKMSEYIAATKKRAEDLENAKRIMMAFSDFRVLYKALDNRNASRGTIQLAEMMQGTGDSVVQIATSLGITDEQMIAASKQIKTGIAAAGQNMEVSASWNKESLGQLKREFEGELGKFELSVREIKADGGLAGNGSKIKGTLISKGYYNGGLVFGQGGPRQDRIPAYLSHGEYVINAAATAKNLELLKAINSGKQVAAGGVNISVYAAPGMNEQDVANIVSAKLTHELYKGMTI